MKEKIINFIKSHTFLSCVALAFVVALITSIIVAAVMAPSDNDDGYDDDTTQAAHDIKWGSGLTKDVPAFSGEAVNTVGTDSYAAAYYKNVTSEQVAQYTALLESELGVTFSSEKYPRSAVWGEKIIAIHFNVTEMKMSVTVVKTSE